MKPYRIQLIIALCLVVLGGWAVWSFWWDSGAGQSAPSAAAPKKAIGFELPDHAGKIHTLEEFRGNVVLLHFWASWCPPCVEEMPQIVQLAQDYKGRKLKVVAVSLDEKWEDALKLLPDGSLAPNMISLIDVKQKISDQYGSYQYPESYLLNPNLEIVVKLIGGQKWDSPTVRKAIDALIEKGAKP